MLTRHSTFHAIHRIDFEPDSFTAADLLWLPHHAQLANSGKKRQTEHLAGRIAAVHALRAFAEKSVPGIGHQRQPVWPAGLHGSISHCGHTAVAIVARAPVGIDIETLFSPALADALANDIAREDELAVLRGGELPFPLALTLAFSAKESLYKALSARHPTLLHFHDAVVKGLSASTITLSLPALAQSASLRWYAVSPQHIITCFSQE